MQSSFRGHHTGAVDRKWQSFPSQQCNGTCQRGRYTCITSITSSLCERQQQVTDCNTVPRLLLQIEIIEVRADHPGGKETFRCLWIVPAFWWLDRFSFAKVYFGNWPLKSDLRKPIRKFWFGRKKEDGNRCHSFPTQTVVCPCTFSSSWFTAIQVSVTPW